MEIWRPVRLEWEVIKRKELQEKGGQEGKEGLAGHEYKGFGCGMPKKGPGKYQKMTGIIKWCRKSEESSEVLVVWKKLTACAMIRRVGVLISKKSVPPTRKECHKKNCKLGDVFRKF